VHLISNGQVHEISPDLLLAANEPWFRPSVLETAAGMVATESSGLGAAVREVLSLARLRCLERR